jgi:beta-glucosidase
MCSYNGVNGEYACQNKYLLTQVLKKDWGFKGFVVSDWGGTHSTEQASAAGLDNEEPLDTWFGPKLLEAVKAGRVPMAELDEHARRVLYAEFASGVVDYPQQKSVVDVEKGFAVSRGIEEKSIVLLKNSGGVLPLSAKVGSVAVIGKNADFGMISGGGSAQVDPPGTPAGRFWRREVWFPTSPMKAVQAMAPGAAVGFASGEDIAAAVAAAKKADVAVVFAWQWEAENEDLPNLSLPGNQDALIAAVAAANPRTVVVLETGTAVTMPWLDKVAGVMEAWYGGSKGADAVGEVLFGAVNPSGKLPMTFPMSESELPRPVIAPQVLKDNDVPLSGKLTATVDYNIEGAAVGYKWFESQKKPVLFPFGFGLSYTSFAYSGLKMGEGKVTFTVTNTGAVAGAEVAEVYARLPESAGEPWKRLVGFTRVQLAPGESQTVTVPVEEKAVSIWDVKEQRWVRPAGAVTWMVGGSSVETPLVVKK